MPKRLLATAVLLLIAAAAPSPINPPDLKWGPGPAGLPPGARMVFLYGNSSKPGLYIMRLRLPSGYAVPPHSHPNDEHVTVLSGQLSMGMGDRMVRARAATLHAGWFMTMPAGTHHFVFTRTGALLQLTGEGPSGITYVHPADDPRRKK
jgi:quercetin dioxygenase-like cupin family protein